MFRKAIPLMIALAALISLNAQQAEIREETVPFKTYPYGEPDPAPIMTRSSMWGRGASLYPYSFFDQMTKEGETRDWRVIRLENEYLRLYVSPGDGGKLLAAIEKSTGKDFVYFNHARKYRNIALRGAWTSGGIEWNFGVVGHTPATASPVDYVIEKNADGSVTAVVGAMDLPSRTEWRIRLTLPADKAYFVTDAMWFNPGPLEQSYYAWANASAKLSDGVEFVLPGTRRIGHNYGEPSVPWPLLSDGRNLALYKNHRPEDDEGSFFVHGKLQEANGGYWHDTKFGYGHWALHEEVPGQKFFRWSLARNGAIWEDLLTDNDGQYFEPQSGRLLDQNDHEFFAPYSTDRWREYWFAYKDIGPLSAATPEGVLHAKTDGSKVETGFNALRPVDDDLVIYNGGKEIFRERLRLKPMETYLKTIDATVKPGALRVRVGETLEYRDDPADGVLKRPFHFRNYSKDTLEGLYQGAERAEKARNYRQALDGYLECLRRDPTSVRALTRAAAIYYRRAEYATALEYAAKALDFVMYDADANYLYGLTARRMGDFTDAIETMGWAARSMKYRSAAYGQLAEIYLVQGNLERAGMYAKRALDFDANNIRTHQFLTTLYRRMDRRQEAEAEAALVLKMDPLNHLARFERYLLNPDEAKLETFRSMIRHELPHETYLEIAAYYRDLGLDGDAAKVLDAAPETAEVRYWQAYLARETTPEESRRLLREAAALSPHLVFPFRQEAIPVFEWAARTEPSDWKAGYYLGLIEWGLTRTEDALKRFEALGERPDFAVFYTSRAVLKQHENPVRAGADYEKARSTGDADWRNYSRLILFQLGQGMTEKALKNAQDAAAKFPKEDAIKIALARTYLATGRYQACYETLDHADVLPFEGQRDIQALYANCQMARAIEAIQAKNFQLAEERLEGSKAYPEHLGSGKPADPDFRVQDYLLMLSYERAGGAANAAKAAARRADFNGWAQRHSRKTWDDLRAKLDAWQSTAMNGKDPAAALGELNTIVKGPRAR